MPAVIPFIPLIAAGIGGATALYSGYKADKQNQAVQQQMQNTQNQQMGLFSQAQQLIPGMQNISNLYGQGAAGFLADRDRLGGIGQQYGGLLDQMQRLYGQNPTAESVNGMRGLLGQNPGAEGTAGLRGLLSQNSGVGNIMKLMQNAGDVQAGGVSDGGYGAQLGANAQNVLAATDPGVYRQQAQLAGNDALGQLSSQLASRGIASSGTSSRLGASTLSRLYADAAARGQQDRLNAYGISNSALGQAGNLALGQSQAQVNADLQAAGMRNSALGQMGNLMLQNRGQEAGLWGQLANLGMQQGNFQAGLLGQMGQMGLSNQQQQAGLLGQMGNLLSGQQGNILAGSGLLGNYLQGLQGQYGMQQGLAGLYNQQAGLLGGIYNQQAGQINPNPYGGFGAALGSFGNAAANYLNWQQKKPTSGVPSTGQSWAGVQYQPAVMPRHYNPYLD